MNQRPPRRGKLPGLVHTLVNMIMPWGLQLRLTLPGNKLTFCSGVAPYYRGSVVISTAPSILDMASTHNAIQLYATLSYTPKQFELDECYYPTST